MTGTTRNAEIYGSAASRRRRPQIFFRKGFKPEKQEGFSNFSVYLYMHFLCLKP